MNSIVTERMTFFASLFEVYQNPEAGMRYLYVTVFLLAVVVYKLGFARKLALWQNLIIYVCMALGCTILSFFAAFLPIAEGLAITAIFLAIYRFRLHLHRKEGEQKSAGQ